MKSKNLEIREIGERLKVRSLVEGSVRRAGETLRVTAQLIGVADGYHLWSATYDRRIEDLFAIQEEIANRIAGALRIRLTAAADRSLFRGRPRGQQAYELVLKGRYFWAKNQPEACWKAIEYFERAIALEPDYAMAYAYMAQTYCYLAIFGVPTGPLRQKAQAAAQAAIDLDDTMYDSHLVTLYCGRRHEEAVAQLRETLEMDPGSVMAQQHLGLALAALNRFDEAILLLRGALDITGSQFLFAGILGHCYASYGMLAEAEQLLGELEALPVHSAVILSALGRSGEAFEFLRKGAGDRSVLFLWIRVWALFDNLMADPRARSFVDEVFPKPCSL